MRDKNKLETAKAVVLKPGDNEKNNSKGVETMKNNSSGYLFVLLIMGILVILSGITLFAQEPFGFRSNGQGRYPDASPVTEWGVSTNVMWKAPMPGGSNASPVLCGDRLFVCSEPSTLVCVNRSDGKILWQKSNDYSDLLTDPGEREKALEEGKKSADLKKALDAKNSESWKLSGQLKKSPEDKDLKKQIEETKKQIEELVRNINQLAFGPPRTEKSNGYTSATPVTDGKLVWAVFGSGVVVCYDREGNRIWGRFIEKPPHEWGSCISPVLAGNMLLVQFDNMYGIEAATGKQQWKTKTPWGWGSPVLVSAGEQTLVYTCKGSAIRVNDGVEVFRGVANLGFNSAVLQDDTIYYIQEIPKAFKPSRDPLVKPKELWTGAKIRNGRYYATPLVHNGLIYALVESDVLTVLDGNTGLAVYEKKLEHLKGTAYSSPTLAGKYIFLSSENGNTVVLEPGREYKEVARNVLEPFRSTPVFSENRMFLRTAKNLFCIGK